MALVRGETSLPKEIKNRSQRRHNPNFFHSTGWLCDTRKMPTNPNIKKITFRQVFFGDYFRIKDQKL